MAAKPCCVGGGVAVAVVSVVAKERRVMLEVVEVRNSLTRSFDSSASCARVGSFHAALLCGEMYVEKVCV